MPTGKIDEFLQLTEMEQTVFLLDQLWNKVDWRKIDPDRGGRPELSQIQRAQKAERFLSLPVDEWVDVNDFEVFHLMFTDMFEFPGDTYHTTILDILSHFSLLKVEYEYNDKQSYKYRNLSRCMVSSVGYKVFHYLSKQKISQEESEQYNDPLTAMFLKNNPIKRVNKVGRNDPCPCGSGKKYKKCCLS